MSILKLLHFILALGTATCTLAEDAPAAKPGQYCTPPMIVENKSNDIRGNFSFCLEVDDTSKAEFLVDVHDAGYIFHGVWRRAEQYESVQLTVEAELLKEREPDETWSEPITVARGDDLLKDEILRGDDYLEGNITAGSYPYEIECTVSLPHNLNDNIEDAHLKTDFTFNIEAK